MDHQTTPPALPLKFFRVRLHLKTVSVFFYFLPYGGPPGDPPDRMDHFGAVARGREALRGRI